MIGKPEYTMTLCMVYGTTGEPVELVSTLMGLRNFLAIGQGRAWGERVPESEVLLSLSQPAGHDYWHLMSLAGRYAYAGREWVARKVVGILNGTEMELVHNHHNFAWKETHEGAELVVVRKGATPAFPGQTGFIGGSMGDDAVIVRGATATAPEVAAAQTAALYSTVHGAGRVMSRTAAAGKRNRKTGQVIAPGRITPDMMHGWLKEKGVILRGGGLDESPQVYRRLPEVLAAGSYHRGSAHAPTAGGGDGRGR
jgi:tRNA-splicing ligase RtcB